MPELPEVETVRRGMLPYLEGQTVARVRVNRPDLRIPFPPDLKERLEGAHFVTLRRRSKYILMDTDRDDTVLLHLGMSGRITLTGAKDERPAYGKHDHVVLETRRGDQMIFTDPRRFGMLTLYPTDTESDHALLRDIGPEPLGNSFNESDFVRALKGRRSPMKAVLLDQKTVAGLGNIYVAEALWRAGINPKRRADQLAKARAQSLVPIIRTVLEDAIASGGSTLRDYVGVSGELGYFQHKFDVYGREGEPCRRAGCGGTVTRITQSGRSTFYCPACQT